MSVSAVAPDIPAHDLVDFLGRHKRKILSNTGDVNYTNIFVCVVVTMDYCYVDKKIAPWDIKTST